jgi:hypothetical protein
MIAIYIYIYIYPLVMYICNVYLVFKLIRLYLMTTARCEVQNFIRLVTLPLRPGLLWLLWNMNKIELNWISGRSRDFILPQSIRTGSWSHRASFPITRNNCYDVRTHSLLRDISKFLPDCTAWRLRNLYSSPTHSGSGDDEEISCPSHKQNSEAPFLNILLYN